MTNTMYRFTFSCIALLLSACERSFVFNEYQSLPNIGWHKDSIASFKIPEIDLDSTKTYHLFINARNDNTYKYSNLFLITTLNFPEGKQQIDTLEYEMAHPNGEWMGTGNHILENKLWYKEGFSFKEKGNYSLNISHAMRKNGKAEGIEFLKGITDIGFRIETATNTTN